MNLSNFYPETVYFCNCLKLIVEKCKKASSLQDLCNEINNNDTGDSIIYCSRCGDDKQDAVLSCGNHLAMGTYVVQYVQNDSVAMVATDKLFCLNCIKRYLRRNYDKFLSKANI